MSKKVVLLYGKSGSGKSAVKKAIMKQRPYYNDVVNSTTRPAREGEVNGVDYYFYNDREMAEKIFKGEMAECVPFRDWVYGTEYAQLRNDQINVGIWNPEGVEILNGDRYLDCLNIFIDAPDKIRMIRSLMRETNPDIREMFRRYEADEKDFDEVDVAHQIVVNNDGTRSIDEVAAEIVDIIDKYLGGF